MEQCSVYQQIKLSTVGKYESRFFLDKATNKEVDGQTVTSLSYWMKIYDKLNLD